MLKPGTVPVPVVTSLVVIVFHCRALLVLYQVQVCMCIDHTLVLVQWYKYQVIYHVLRYSCTSCVCTWYVYSRCFLCTVLPGSTTTGTSVDDIAFISFLPYARPLSAAGKADGRGSHTGDDTDTRTDGSYDRTFVRKRKKELALEPNS